MIYRQRETEAVLRAWTAGQSVSVVGVGSAGKSNFVAHLASSGALAGPPVYWPDGLLPIVIDANMLGPLPAAGGPERDTLAFWAGCELLLHRTFMALYPFDRFSEQERTTLYQAYEALQDGANPLFAQLALRYLELGLSVPIRAGLRLAFMFDEFERLAALLPVGFFQSLRGLRDLHKRRLTYTAVSRTALLEVLHIAGLDALQVEPFAELFNDQVVYLGPYSLEDAQAMIQDLLGRRGAALNASAVASLLAVTGGHAGLLRAAVYAVLDQPTLGRLPIRDLTPALLNLPAIGRECAAIWFSLGQEEQAALISLQRGRKPENAATAPVLQEKGLLGRKFQIQPPLLAGFLALQAAS